MTGGRTGVRLGVRLGAWLGVCLGVRLGVCCGHWISVKEGLNLSCHEGFEGRVGNDGKQEALTKALGRGGVHWKVTP